MRKNGHFWPFLGLSKNYFSHQFHFPPATSTLPRLFFVLFQNIALWKKSEMTPKLKTAKNRFFGFSPAIIGISVTDKFRRVRLFFLGFGTNKFNCQKTFSWNLNFYGCISLLGSIFMTLQFCRKYMPPLSQENVVYSSVHKNGIFSPEKTKYSWNKNYL